MLDAGQTLKLRVKVAFRDMQDLMVIMMAT
jgi:hypothetical protein